MVSGQSSGSDIRCRLSCDVPRDLGDLQKEHHIENSEQQGSLFRALPLIVWGLLWLSGKNQGETARLWLVLYPWLLWMMVPMFEGKNLSQSDGRIPSLRLWKSTLIWQMFVSLLTVLRVTGFHFTVS